jgi:hypothetical protein
MTEPTHVSNKLAFFRPFVTSRVAVSRRALLLLSLSNRSASALSVSSTLSSF